MFAKLALPRIIRLVICVVGGIAAGGCGKSSPPVGPAAPPAPASAAPQQPYSTYLFSNAKAHLRPLNSDAPVDAEKAKVIWRELLPGMVADEKSRELLRLLHGDLPADLVLIDAAQAEDQDAMAARPPQGVAVAFRVADKIVSEEKLKRGANPVPVRVVNYCQVVLIENAATKSAPNMASAMSGMTNVFKDLHPVEPLYLLMEDYVLRHAPGWILIRDVSDAEPELPASVEEQRRDLDLRIQAFAERAKTYYDSLRKPY